MKKMVLLPYDRYQRLLSTSTSLDNVSPSEYSTQPTDEQTQKESHSELAPTNETLAEPTDRTEDLILQFTKSMRPSVRNLLRYLQPHLLWDDKGEVTIDQHPIPGSNIVDLLKVYLKDYKDFQPVGKNAFGRLLENINVPRSLLASSARHSSRHSTEEDLLPHRSQSGGSPLPPPPGIPAKRSEGNLQAPAVKWRRL